MSRSFKRTPGFTDQQRRPRTSKWFKRQANKKVRKMSPTFLIPDGKSYRMFYNPYDICDWKFLAFTPDAEEHFLRYEQPHHMYRK